MGVDDPERKAGPTDARSVAAARPEPTDARTEFYMTIDGTAATLPDRKQANEVVLEDGSIKEKLAMLEALRDAGDTRSVLITAKATEREEAHAGFDRMKIELRGRDEDVRAQIQINQDQGKHAEAYIELRLESSGANYSLQELHGVAVANGSRTVVVDVMLRTREDGAPIAPAEIKEKVSGRASGREVRQAEGLVELAKGMPNRTLLYLTNDGKVGSLGTRLAQQIKELVILEDGPIERRLQTLNEMRSNLDNRPVLLGAKHTEVESAELGLRQLHQRLSAGAAPERSLAGATQVQPAPSPIGPANSLFGRTEQSS